MNTAAERRGPDRRLGRFLVVPGILATIGMLVIYPVFFLVTESLNVGDAGTFPPEEFGFGNYRDMVSDTQVLWNTAFVAGLATVMAIGFGLLLAWILTRTAIPGRARLERLMELPYYMTPLVGALAWGVIASPKTGLANQLARLLGTNGDVLNIYSPWGIAWVMALFEGTVAFVMISAAMKSMDPSMEESARVLGAGKFRVALTVTLPMILPGIVSATIFVFAEMLSAFAAAFVLGIPSRFIVITTVIWQSTSAYPPEYGRAAAMGLCLFVVLAVAIGLARLVLRKGSYATITGKAFRPRPLRLGARAWPMVTVCWAYLTFAVFLPMAALLMTSFQKFATVIVGDMRFTLDNYVIGVPPGGGGLRPDQQHRAGPERGDGGILAGGGAGLGDLPRPRAGAVPGGIRRDVSAGGAAAGVRTGPAVGVAVDRTGVAVHPVWHTLDPGPGLPDGAAAAGRAHPGRRGAADRQEPGGMRARVRRILEPSDAHRDLAADAARDRRGLAADLHLRRCASWAPRCS